ncbi:MAG: Ig domain-containing protein, partial [Verrucomicrobiota bacterium]
GPITTGTSHIFDATFIARLSSLTPPLALWPMAGTLNRGQIGAAYNLAFTASGGPEPYGYAVTSGSLPPGLTLSNGVLAGTPTTLSDYNFSITVTNSSAMPGNAAYLLSVIPAQGRDLDSDTWVGIDALRRTLPTYSDGRRDLARPAPAWAVPGWVRGANSKTVTPAMEFMLPYSGILVGA